MKELSEPTQYMLQVLYHDRPTSMARVQTVLGQSLGYASSRMETSERLCVCVCVCVCVCDNETKYLVQKTMATLYLHNRLTEDTCSSHNLT